MVRTPRSPVERLKYSLDELRPPIARLNRRLVWVAVAACALIMLVFSLSLGSSRREAGEGRDRPIAPNTNEPWWESEPDGVVALPVEASPVRSTRPRPRSEALQAAMDSPLSVSFAAVAPPAGAAQPLGRAPELGAPSRARPEHDSQVPGYDVKAGTLIPAALMTAINSEQPGPVVAQVTDDIRDTVSSNHVLIPKGSRLLCEYQSAAARGQTRLVLGCSRLIFPNGESQRLPEEPAADLAGTVGVPGELNRHLLASFGTAAMLAVISGGTQISQGSFDRAGSDPREIMAGALGQQLGQTSNEILRRELNRTPTIEVAAGARFTVHVTRDISFERPYGA
ncbi:MAG: TrbI/VirB10 family protein [bacterium]|nr:TrbI/VirB10 family protein [bacterium]